MAIKKIYVLHGPILIYLDTRFSVDYILLIFYNLIKENIIKSLFESQR